MQDIDFFAGQRALEGVVVSLNRGKTTVVFTPWEEWRLIDPCPFIIRCGNTRTEKLTQRYGIERTNSSSFESSIGSSLGMKGIAAVESSLKTTLGEEVTFSAGTEREQTFFFDSPKCGNKVVRLYQLVRAIHVAYQDTRFWHRDAAELTLVYWLASIYDATHAEQYDPQCDCNDPAKPPREGLPARLVVEGAAKLAVQWSDNHQIEFADGGSALDAYFNGDPTTEGQLPSNTLPDYLRFLAGVESDKVITARLWLEGVHIVGAPCPLRNSQVQIEMNEDFEVIETAVAQPVAVAGLPERDELKAGM